MTAKPALAAIDWGTTRLRAWLLDVEGSVLAEQRGDDGLASARESGFAKVLERHLEGLGAPPGLPVVMCGMVGARQGWIEAPYVDVPAPLVAVLEGAARVPDADRDVRIVPGLAQRRADAPDVMRGEETQLAGAGLEGGARHIVCMPGTHSKWVQVDDGAVTSFGTWPTGELYSVLASHSILRHSLGEHPATVAAADPVFRHWCETALGEGGDVTARLFSIRAASLLHGLGADDAAACLSGLLLGAEVASAVRRQNLGQHTVTLVASGPLGELYQAALALAGLSIRRVNADEAVCAGLLAAARRNGMVA